MSPKHKPSVSEIVETYMKKYPQTERKGLRALIIFKYPNEINSRTLDRCLKKSFEKPSEILESRSEIPEPNPDELSAFMQFPRSFFACSIADENLKRKYPEWYRRNKKAFDEVKRLHYGFSGFITNPQPRKHKVNQKDEKMREDDN